MYRGISVYNCCRKCCCCRYAQHRLSRATERGCASRINTSHSHALEEAAVSSCRITTNSFVDSSECQVASSHARKIKIALTFMGGNATQTTRPSFPYLRFISHPSEDCLRASRPDAPWNHSEDLLFAQQAKSVRRAESREQHRGQKKTS